MTKEVALQGIAYKFLEGADAPVLSDATAVELQGYYSSFAGTGVPSGASLPHLPLYGMIAE